MARRADVLLLCIKGFNNTEIANKLEIHRDTVKSDLKLLLDDIIDWTENLALIGWMKKVEEIYIESDKSINHIVSLQEQLREKQDATPFTWDANPFNPETHTEDYLKFEDIKRKAYSAYATRITHYGEYAQLENAKTKVKEFLVGMTTQIPLFAATQRLAIYYQQNEQKKALPDPSNKSQNKILKTSS